jgi:hypothetical protein
MAPDHQVERRTREQDQRQEFHSTLEIFEEKGRMDLWSVSDSQFLCIIVRAMMLNQEELLVS